jgi:hypothetical protein
MGHARRSIRSGHWSRATSCRAVRARITAVGAVGSAGILVLGVVTAPAGFQQRENRDSHVAACGLYAAAGSTSA